MQSDTLIITPNRRLASALRTSLEQKIAATNTTCFVTPSVLPINVWMNELWNSYSRQCYAPLPHLLNSTQEAMLFESIIRESPWHEYLLQVAETARLVRAAHGLLQQWQVDLSDPLFDTADDYAACKYWLNQFKVKCEDEHWLDSASLPAVIIRLIKQGEMTLPKIIYHAGFTSLSPQLETLLQSAASAGSEVSIYELCAQEGMVIRTDAETADDEMMAIARFAQQHHAKEPDASIACVFPGLDKQRERIRQIFTEIIGDEQLFNLSAGRPLAEFPVINAAINILSLSSTQLTLEQTCFLLATPFMAGGESEYLRRSQLDQWLRSRNFNVVTREVINCPKLNKHLHAFQVLLEGYSDSATYLIWAERFNHLLKAMGWPGERVLNSEEYQVVSEWLALLQELTTLDVTSHPVGLQTALHALTQLARSKPFQAQTPAARIQILGVLEAAGLSFDYLWVSGLDDNTWPAQPKPNPFIPKKLQRELSMPHASAERELHYCETMLMQFANAAKHVVLSHARQQDETPLQASPLIKHFAYADLSTLTGNLPLAFNERIYESHQIETLLDNAAPVYQSTETISGGVEVIRQQAQCPFKAFSECRLGARPLERPLPGLRPKERGTIVHKILEKCWQQLRDRDALLTISDETLIALLTTIIEGALTEHAKAQQHQNSYLNLEKQRLLKLILNWLAIEKERPPFRVQASEKDTSIQLGALSLNMRIDRIDDLGEGRKLIIDYKTSSNLKITDWLGSRMDAPQLPLYAQLDRTNTVGIAYAEVTMNQSKYKGISDDDLEIKGIKPAEKATQGMDWRALNADWEASLQALSADFCNGKADVDPKEADNTCQYCQLQPLCRVHESL